MSTEPDGPKGRELARSIDPERQRRAKEYARISRRIFLVETALGLGVLLLLWLGGLSVALRDALDLPRPARVAAYFAVVAMGYGLLLSPLAYCSGFLLPHRFGLSVQTLKGWVWDIAKSGGIGFILGLGAVEALYWLLERQPDLWWLWAGMGFFFVSVVLAQLAPVLLLPLFFRLRPLEDQDLVQRLTQLARRAGARVRGVFVMDLSRKATTANAALTGLGGTRRIILADSLLAAYTPDEVEVVLAHELGHHVHRDIPKLLLVQGATTLLGFYLASVALRAASGRFGLAGVSDIAGLPLLILVTISLSTVLIPAANAFSRRLEANADRYAVETTDKPEAFISMMMKLTDQNLSEAEPASWARHLFYSHPPLPERIAIAEGYRSHQAA